MKKIICIILMILLLIPSYAHGLNEKEMEYCNIIEWQQKYTGKGVKILISDIGYIHPDTDFINMENIVTPIHKVTINGTDTSTETHLQKVTQIIQSIAPDAKIYINNMTLENSISMAINNDIQIITRSISAHDGFTNSENEIFKEAYDKGIFMNGSAGNTIFNKYAENPYWFSTGAVRLQNNKVYKEDYSQTGEQLDYMGFARLNVYEDSNMDGKGSLVEFWGTSASAPWVSGMTALYYQYYYETYDKYPTVAEVEEFIINNCKDLQDKGYDIETGYGLFILPKLENLERDRFIKIVGIDNYNTIMKFSMNIVKGLLLAKLR